jgi:uncharacterized protein (TIGR00369 family)
MQDDLTEEKAEEVRASFARQGLMGTIGGKITALEKGRCVIELAFSPAVSQQHGFFHGGIVGAMADTAGGYAGLSVMPAASDVVTLEYKMNFLRPAAGEVLVAVGTVLRAGRAVTVTRADVFITSGGERRLCAAMQQSLMAAKP